MRLSVQFQVNAVVVATISMISMQNCVFLMLLEIFFDEKISRAQKHVTSENQLTKQK